MNSFYPQEDNDDDNGLLQQAVEWAAEAAKLVFADIENPSEENLVTFLTLGLFWSSQNDWKRLEIHSGGASWHIQGFGISRQRTREQQVLESRVEQTATVGEFHY
ncbi:hypothetical protein N7470_006341 [Penicillium chermesinum]|nr:hypothetical protein N7470_006341 [Penicillium chermesinum]